jgi:hypothetical protein
MIAVDVEDVPNPVRKIGIDSFRGSAAVVQALRICDLQGAFDSKLARLV